jgi:signal transduction histidine kinase
MQTRRIFWKIYPGYLAVMLLALLAVSVLSSTFISRFYHHQTAESLAVQARFAAEQVRDQLDAAHTAELSHLCNVLGGKSSARITLILFDGTVVGDSDKAAVEMKNHSDRPEVLAALDGQIGRSVRYSDTLQKKMMYVAVLIERAGQVIGVVRTSMPLTEMDRAIDVVQSRILFGGLIILLLSAWLSLQISRRISRPLADRMNDMEAQLEERLQSLNRLENIRRDFVANVSHELKTPITSIKGFVETLLDGAMDDPEEAERFLQIVSKHSNRLNAIIEDLLTLSRLEQDSSEGIEMQSVALSGLIRSAAEVCAHRAEKKNITIKIECSDSLSATINPPLIEQALINLISNALKYSVDDKTVTVSAYTKQGGVILSVIDQGYGIEPEQLGRLFERFYRVDKGRSRQEGGTGLGLAIVKHIAQAHGGTVSVKSTFGVSSTFSITLPAA